MRTLHLYLLRQLSATLVVTVGVFTLVLLLGNVLREVLDLMASGQASFALAAKAVGLLIPFVLAFSLPIGLLTASLLVFGRFSADQELTAVRAGGISLVTLVLPVVVLSVLLCGVCAVVNMEVAPASRVAFKALRDSVLRDPKAQFIPEGRYVALGPDLTLFAHEVRGRELSDVLISGTTNLVKGGVTNRVPSLEVWAATAELVLSNAFPSMLVLRKVQGLVLTGDDLQPFYTEEIPYALPPQRTSGQGLKLNEMTFSQLRAERRLRASQGVNLTPVDVQLHRQLAFSFACVSFTLVGIPLGIRAHRRETNIGIAVALLLLTVYYSFVILGQALEARPDLHPELMFWIPNFLFQGIGGALLWRADRGV